jgi:hypothetical protein
MASKIVLGFASVMEEHVDVAADISSCYSVVNGYEPSSPSLISSSGSIEEPADDQLSIVSALRVMTRHLLSARIVAHFMSLALTAPCCVISPMLRNRGHFPHSPCHVWRNVVRANHFTLYFNLL